MHESYSLSIKYNNMRTVKSAIIILARRCKINAYMYVKIMKYATTKYGFSAFSHSVQKAFFHQSSESFFKKFS